MGISSRQLRFRRWLSYDPAGYCEIATSAAPPRNDKSGVRDIFMMACSERQCRAGRGMPLPYNGGYHEAAAGTGRQCLPEIAPQGRFLALRAPRRPLASSQWQSRRLSAFFLIHFSVFRIHSFPCPAPTANSPARRKKSSDLSIGASCWRYLSSRAVTRKVLSAQMSLTSVFGMGTGVPSPQSTPTIWGHTLKTEQE